MVTTSISEEKLEASSHGLYSPNSITWRINRESALLLGGLRALTMQVSHPKVAQGVYDHSNFQNEPLGRLIRTLSTMLQISFGTAEESRIAAERIRRVHRTVQGKLSETAGEFAKETAYYAADPGLMIWVYATLVDSSIYMYELLISELSAIEKEQYFQESKLWVEKLGVPPDHLPEDYQAFREYVEKMLTSHCIVVGEVGEAVLDGVFYPALPFIPRFFYEPLRFFTAGLLPPVLRQKAGMKWSKFRKVAFRGIVQSIRLFLPLLPGFIRIMPQARKAEKRWWETEKAGEIKSFDSSLQT